MLDRTYNKKVLISPFKRKQVNIFFGCVFWWHGLFLYTFTPLFLHHIRMEYILGLNPTKFIIYSTHTRNTLIQMDLFSCHSSCMRTLPFLFLRNWQQLRRAREVRLVRLIFFYYRRWAVLSTRNRFGKTWDQQCHR